MNFKYLFLCTFILYESASTSPVLREVESLLEHLEPSEDIIREKRKFDLLQHLESGGVGIKKTAEEEGAPEEDSLRPEITPVAGEEKPADGEESTRTRKQAPDNVGSGGKTSCGRVISARGPATKMFVRDHPGLYQEGQLQDSKTDRYPSMQSRTFDSLLPVSSLPGALTLAVPATTSLASDATLAHTLPAIAAPAVPVAPIAHIEPLSLNLLPHSVPIPSLHGMHAMLAHRPLVNLQRLELPKLPEIIYAPAEVKQPAYEVKPVIAARPVATAPYVYPTRYGSSGFEGPMICHPYDEKLAQQVIQIRPEVHVVESATKTLNSSVEEFKSQSADMNEDDERKLREHMRQVNEIREEINQLNRAAQKIVDQQERLAEMQQRHLWRSEDKGTYSQYNPLRMYLLPPGPPYSRANALAYPTSTDDIEFFVNMLKAGKKIGALSETFQPALTSAMDAASLVLGGDRGDHGPKGGKGASQEAAKGQSVGGKTNVQ